MAAACSDDADVGAGGNAGTSSAGKAGAGSGGRGSGAETAGGTSAGASVSGGMAGRSGSGNPSGGTAGSASQPSGGAAGAAGAGEEAAGTSGGAGAAGAAAGAGGDAGAGGEVPVGEPGFAYVSTILGGLVALSADAGGDLQKLDGSPVGNGHLSNVLIDHRKKFLYTLDADRHEISLYPLSADGKLPADPVAQTPVAEQPLTAVLAPSDKFMYVTSQADGVLSTFAVGEADGKLTEQGEPLDLDAPPAFVAVSPSGEYLYVSQPFPGGIRGFAIAQDGSLSELDASPFAAGVVFGGALAFTPGGEFLYSSGFGLNGFAVAADGSLERVGEQTFSDDVGSDFYASNLAIDPLGKYVVVSEFLLTRHVQVFSIDAESGGLVAASPPVTARSPYSVAIDASGSFVYASNDDDTISGYRLKRSNGTLKELPGSPFPFGGLQPEMVIFQP